MNSVLRQAMMQALVCPLHRTSSLIRSEGDTVFTCAHCQRRYESIQAEDRWIPNFLIDDKNWERGPRGIRSALLNKMQGQPNKTVCTSDKLILDVGCGENAKGNVNVDCYLPAQIPSNFILANAEYLPFGDGTIDIVSSYYNIEHLLNPAVFIQNIFGIAREKIEIVTDNSEWVGDIFFRLLGDGRIFNDEHYYKWSAEYLTNLMKRLGYPKNRVYLLNLSNNILVKSLACLGRIPRAGNFFYRDLKVEIWK